MQTQAVYDWTLDLFPLESQPRLSLDDCQALVTSVWWSHGTGSPPRVIDSPNQTPYATRTRILLPSWARCPSLILHEVAHSLSVTEDGKAFVGEGWDDHGPRFVDLAMTLYRTRLGTDLPTMQERARAYGVKY